MWVDNVIRVLDPFFLHSKHGVARLFTHKVLVVISGQTGFALEITLKYKGSKCPKGITHQVIMVSIVPIFPTGFQGHLCNITQAPFHLSLKIRKSHGSTGC